MQPRPALALSACAVLAALLVGRRHSPDPTHPATAAWYASLEKPSFTPPSLVFGIVWPILGALLSFTGYRLATQPPSPVRRVALAAWLLDVLGIASHSWVFFGRKSTGEAVAVTAGMLAATTTLVPAAAKLDPPAAWAASPFLPWLLFANLLQAETWRRNR